MELKERILSEDVVEELKTLSNEERYSVVFETMYNFFLNNWEVNIPEDSEECKNNLSSFPDEVGNVEKCLNLVSRIAKEDIISDLENLTKEELYRVLLVSLDYNPNKGDDEYDHYRKNTTHFMEELQLIRRAHKEVPRENYSNQRILELVLSY